MFLRRVHRQGWPKALFASALLFLAGMAQVPPSPPPQTISFEINTGATTGTYYPVGEALAKIISHPVGSVDCSLDRPCGPEGLIAVVQTSQGSVMNALEVNRYQAASALAQADIVSRAYHGDKMIDEGAAQTNVRAIANLFPEHVHLIARRGAGIASPRDLKGQRVAVGFEGSGSHVIAERILKAYGVKPSQVKLVKAGPDVASNLLLLEELDAFFFVGGTPVRAVTYLADHEVIDLVPLAGAEIDALLKQELYFHQSPISGETYKGLEATETIAVGALWIVNDQVPAEQVYLMTKALWSAQNRDLLKTGHEKGELMILDRALSGIPVPLHPGAAKFYREEGLLLQ